MIPTDEQLEDAAALLCGWEPAGRTGIFALLWLEPVTKEIRPRPQFCSNRNALPELWNVVLKAGRDGQFITALRDVMLGEGGGQVLRFDLITSSPRLQVMAALRACGVWQEEWDVSP